MVGKFQSGEKRVFVVVDLEAFFFSSFFLSYQSSLTPMKTKRKKIFFFWSLVDELVS